MTGLHCTCRDRDNDGRRSAPGDEAAALGDADAHRLGRVLRRVAVHAHVLGRVERHLQRAAAGTGWLAKVAVGVSDGEQAYRVQSVVRRADELGRVRGHNPCAALNGVE